MKSKNKHYIFINVLMKINSQLNTTIQTSFKHLLRLSVSRS